MVLTYHSIGAMSQQTTVLMKINYGPMALQALMCVYTVLKASVMHYHYMHLRQVVYIYTNEV